MPAMAHNHVRPEGGTMPRLDDTAVAEGLQHLPGWERHGNEIINTFLWEEFAQAMGSSTRSLRRRGGRRSPRYRHPLERGHPGSPAMSTVA
jgi:hypothetical protein